MVRDRDAQRAAEFDGRVLVTGATGKTGHRLAALLREAQVDYLAASRAPAAEPNSVTFDWMDARGYDAALDGVTSIYVIFPSSDHDPAPLVIDFCRKALDRGVRRIVLLSGSLLPEGGPYMGQLHAWLHAEAPEWAVLRPSWFMQNFAANPYYQQSIRTERTIYSATGTGRVGFIDAGDIARSAFGVLVDRQAANREFVLTGPEALSYDEAARKISEAAGYEIRHVPLSVDAFTARLVANGFSSGVAATLGRMDGFIARGVEARTTDDVLIASGSPPTAFDTFVQAEHAAWLPSASNAFTDKENDE